MLYLVKIHPLLASSLFCEYRPSYPLLARERPGGRSKERQAVLLSPNVDAENWSREPVCPSPGHRASHLRSPEGSATKAHHSALWEGPPLRSVVSLGCRKEADSA